MRNWISFPKRQGNASRQAHASLPAGAYERSFDAQGLASGTYFYTLRAPGIDVQSRKMQLLK